MSAPAAQTVAGRIPSLHSASPHQEIAASPHQETSPSHSEGALSQNPGSAIAPPTPQPSFAASCETEVSANCEAKMESRYTATGGDPAPAWSAPTPTTIPPTPAAPQISEPQTDPALVPEQSGGAARPAIEGGGPTLTDCMALWEPAVHMTKALWQTVCVRTLNGVDMPSAGLGLHDPGQARPQRHAAR